MDRTCVRTDHGFLTVQVLGDLLFVESEFLLERRRLSKGSCSPVPCLQEILDTRKLFWGFEADVEDVQILSDHEVTVVEVHLLEVVLFPEGYDLLRDIGVLALLELDAILGPLAVLEDSVEDCAVKLAEPTQTTESHAKELPAILQELVIEDETDVFVGLDEPEVPEIGADLLFHQPESIHDFHFRRQILPRSQLGYSEVFHDQLRKGCSCEWLHVHLDSLFAPLVLYHLHLIICLVHNQRQPFQVVIFEVTKHCRLVRLDDVVSL